VPSTLKKQNYPQAIILALLPSSPSISLYLGKPSSSLSKSSDHESTQAFAVRFVRFRGSKFFSSLFKK
jgi:hypothetical protein